MDKDIHNKWLVIVNPNAGKGRGGNDWNIISGLLHKAGLAFESKFTERKGHAIQITVESINAGFRKIITVGGDGTLNEVTNGVFLNTVCPTYEITIGHIPVGTGNDWGRMFGIPGDYSGAVEIIRKSLTMLQDVGVINYSEGEKETTRYFLNIAGAGFESAVVERTNYQKERGHHGKLIYLYNLLVALFLYRNKKVRIIIDGEEKKARIFSISIGNGRYCGGGMRQTPNALPDDGILDVTIIKEMGKFEIIRNLNILYNGRILEHPKIDGYRCSKVELRSDSPVYLEADGEFLGHTPATFTLLPGSIRIIYGTLVTV